MTMLDATSGDRWQWEPYFKPAEFACHHCHKVLVDPAFMDWLFSLRVEYGKPMVVTSGYRCPIYNAQVSSTGYGGPHTKGAVDISVQGPEARRLLDLAVKHGVTGIGVNQKGPFQGRFLHLDMLTDSALRPRVWTY